MSKNHKLDIFETLNAIDKHELNFYQSLPDENKKGFAPRVVLRWASATSGTYSSYYLEAINELVNVRFDELSSHPNLQYKLMALCGVGKRQQHKWIPIAKSKTSKSSKLYEFMEPFHPLASIKELAQVIKMYSREEFADFLRHNALNKTQTKELMDAFDQFIESQTKKD